jgi:hypothetical protein
VVVAGDPGGPLSARFTRIDATGRRQAAGSLFFGAKSGPDPAVTSTTE